jgi:hypothetical protein
LDPARTNTVFYMKVDPRIDLPMKFQNDFLLAYPIDTLRGLIRMSTLH